jgi:hypothetical protein
MGHWSSVLAVAAAAAGACDAHGTEVRVYFDVQGELPAQARSLAIRVHDHEGVMQSPSPFALADLTLPAWLRVTPRGDDATRRYEVIGELLGPDDVPIARQRAISRYVAGELREIRLVFDTSCNDILCDDGLSCFEGACTDACVEPTLPGEVPRSVFVGCSPPPAGCDPAGYPTCAADALLTCVDGMERRTPCGLGCALGAPACVEPVTSNVPQIGFDEGTANVVVPRGETWVLDTDTRSRATSASRRCEKPCAASAGPRSSTPIRARR